LPDVSRCTPAEVPLPILAGLAPAVGRFQGNGARVKSRSRNKTKPVVTIGNGQPAAPSGFVSDAQGGGHSMRKRSFLSALKHQGLGRKKFVSASGVTPEPGAPVALLFILLLLLLCIPDSAGEQEPGPHGLATKIVRSTPAVK